MSFLKPTPKNPVSKWIEYKGETGVFQYWDKNLKDSKGDHVVIPTKDVKFIVLDSLNCITGYNKASKCGIYSNEVYDLRRDKLEVRTFKGNLKIVGLYSEIKSSAKEEGGKFTKSVYAALIDGSSLELVNFKFSGSGFEGWVDLNIREDKDFAMVTGFENKENGRTKYKKPVFGSQPIPETLIPEATKLATELNEFLSHRDIQKSDEDEGEETQDESQPDKEITAEDLVGNPYKQMENAKTLDDIKTVWTDNPMLRTDAVFMKLKEKMKEKLSEKPAELDDVKKMNDCTTVEGLDKVYDEIKSAPMWGQYDPKYKAEVDNAYKVKLDILLPF